MKVRPKKHLGQHFLTCSHTAEKIANILDDANVGKVVLEIGPGMGMLTQFLLAKKSDTYLVEIDKESVHYLINKYPHLYGNIFSEDFLKMDISLIKIPRPFSIIGNFPYNISSQIVFKVLDLKNDVLAFGGMFQKEVAERISAHPGSKTYGILSVLTQAFYEVDYLFTVPPTVFNPPPKVDSGVIVCKRYRSEISVSFALFKTLIKTAFGQRRKTLRNSLKSFGIPENLRQDGIFSKRPEQVSVESFIHLASALSKQ